MISKAMVVVVTLTILGAAVSKAAPAVRWAVYYSDKEPWQKFAAFDLLVFDCRYHPPLEGLVRQGKTVYGYLSLGEVDKNESYFREVKAEGILKGENRNWKGSYFVDVRDPRWKARVLNQLIPAVQQQGFAGVFLDTLDDAEYLESLRPRQNAGMKDAAADLVRAIRDRYPQLKIMQNRGFELLDRTAGSIDAILGESIYSDYHAASKTYRLTAAPDYRAAIDRLKALRVSHPGVLLLTLDYWNPSDKAGIARIYETERAHGFHPYVATLALDLVVPEPEREP